jgi:uncharacterized protein YqeY
VATAAAITAASHVIARDRVCERLRIMGRQYMLGRPVMRGVDEWREVLRAALREAMRKHQTKAVAVLRETLAAIDNAEAVDASAAPPVQHGVIAGGVAGLGAGEVPRRRLSADEATAIVEREIQDRRNAATAYESLGRDQEAAVLRFQVGVLIAL